MESKIHPNVSIGENCEIDDNTEIGRPPRGRKSGELETIIGNNCTIRSGTIIYAGANLGDNVQTGHNALIREDNKIGDNSSVGTSTELAPGNIIGKRTRIHGHCFLEETTIGDDVFIAPGAVFTDDTYPVSPMDASWVKGATVGDKSVIGGGAVILPNIVIGSRVLIGAGAVVTKDVPDGKVAYGNPARVTGNTSDIVQIRDGKPVRPYGEEY